MGNRAMGCTGVGLLVDLSADWIVSLYRVSGHGISVHEHGASIHVHAWTPGVGHDESAELRS